MLTGTSVATSLPGYSGSGYVTGFVNGTQESVAIPVTVAEGGHYRLTLRYASLYETKLTRLSVNGVDLGEVVLPHSTSFAEATGPTVPLLAGANTVTLYSDWGYYEIDALRVELVAPPPAAFFEAESGTLSDGKATPTLRVADSRPGHSGSGYVEGFINGWTESVAIPVEVPVDGEYRLTLRYASIFEDKLSSVRVDGADTGQWWLPRSATFTTASGPVVTLAAGAHTVTIFSNWGYYEIDGIRLDFLPPAASHYEAEDGMHHGVAVASDRPGHSGTGYVTGFDAEGDALMWQLELALSGSYRVRLRYAAPFDSKLTRLLVDGVDRGEVMLPFSTGFADAEGPLLQLSAGSHALTLRSDWGYYDVDRVDVDFAPPPAGTQFEAETGTLDGAEVLTSRAGFSGGGYVGGFASPEASIVVPVQVASSGNYRVTLRYAAPSEARSVTLFVNGADYGAVALPASESFSSATGPIVSLQQGLDTIAVSRAAGLHEIDRIDLEPVPPPLFQIAPHPIDPLATPEAVALYRHLRGNFGRCILSGQAEEPTSTPNVWHDRIVAVTGKLPAVRALDFLPFTAQDGWDDGSTERAIAHHELGGIVSYQWHWFAPPTGYEYGAGSFDVAKAVDPSQPEHQLVLDDIDAVATQLSRLAAAGVPVLFRPLHEAEMGFFWWGAGGPGPALELYRMLQERLMLHHGLHNLLWVWNSVGPDWYPGNHAVDVVSIDVYRNPRDYALPPASFLQLAELSGGRKLIALAENGPIPDPKLLAASRTLYSWFNTWHGIAEEPEHLVDVYQHPKVLTLDPVTGLGECPRPRCGLGAELVMIVPLLRRLRRLAR